MKNMKIAAAAVVMVMLASAAIVGMNATTYDAEDAAPAQDGTQKNPYVYSVNLSNKDSVTVELLSNINYYKVLGGATIAWEKTFTDENTKVTVTPKVNGTINADKLTVTVEKNGETNSVDFNLKATVTVKKNNATVTLEPIYYRIQVKIENNFTLNLNGMTFTRNVNDSQTLTTGNNKTPVSPGDSALFYAIGLPDGLSMTPDGKISGIPTKNATNNTAKVFIENADGTVITGDLAVTIQDFGYNVYASATIGDDSTLLAKNNNTYIVEKGQALSIKTLTDGANYVSVCNSDGTSKLIAITNNACNLSSYTSGTGAYKVYIGYADGNSPTYLSKTLASFDLYIVGSVVGVGSDIIIGSR